MTKEPKYPTVSQLPAGAIAIRNYADSQGITVAYVYIKHDRGKADYKIINYQGINFVIPS